MEVWLLSALRRLLKSKRRRDSESTSRTENASGEENEALRRDLEPTLTTDDPSREDNKALRSDSESTLRTDDPPTTSMDDVCREENEALRRDSESALRMDDLITSRTNDVSEEENEPLRSDSESTSRTDSGSKEEYDVFLSFRGSDTRLNFTDFLYRSMVRVGIRVFLDSEELKDGENINEVLNALNKCRIYMPIFSRNFASSSWCLREVERMVACHSKSNGKKEIIPIFYDVKTDDVKFITNLYKNAMLNHMEKFASKEVQQWETALKTVGKIIGRELQGKRQGEQIESIVEEVYRKLNTRQIVVTEQLVEDDAQVEAIIKLLDLGSDGVRFVGIHGTGGIGKTTLAKVVFNKLYLLFDDCCFLEEVRASSQPHDGLLNLQKKLLSGFASSGITDQIKDGGGGIKMIKQVLSNKKVLIILDDLDEREQLENLAGKSNWFGSGSRIIITTREESILKTQVDQSQRILPYEALGMSSNLGLRLFYKHAFRNDSAEKEHEASSREIVRTVGMLPLAIVVIGSHLFDVGNDLGHLEKKAIWDDALKKLNQGPFDKVRKALAISYGQLEGKEKEVFLDIACFFTNCDKTYPFIMWEDCGYYPSTTMRVLSHKSLVKIRDDNRFWMHDQVRDFGRYIVLEEYPRKFCRVWIREKAVNLLERKERNWEVEALSLMFDDHNFTKEELACLPNLRFLQVKQSDFSGNFKNLLSELRWLSWRAQQTSFHANNFHFSKLVVLDLSGSDIGDGWGGWSHMKMNRLKVLDLTGCRQLKRTPDFSNFMSLEMLILAWCVKLTTIDRSIGKLKLLKTLNIKGCSSLGELPLEMGSLQSLTEIVMPQNSRLLKLPKTFGNLKSLLSLILDGHPEISQLPKSIGGLVKITYLSLRGCVKIKELPCSIGELQTLVELDASESGLVELPNSIGDLKKLKVIRISHTVIKKLPRTIGGAEMLEELHAKKCWDLTHENLEEIGKLSHLRILDLSYTHVSRFPPKLSCLSGLQTLELGSRHLQEVPDLPPNLTRLHLQACHFASILDLSRLIDLNYLKLSRLTVSAEEPDPTGTNDLPGMQLIHQFPSNLSTLKCTSIGVLPPLSNLKDLSVLCVIDNPMSHLSISQGLIHLRKLKLSRCSFLVEIPGLSLLKNLEFLNLDKLPSLIVIPDLSKLESLVDLHISFCDQMERLPNLSKLDKLQRIEVEECPQITTIEGLEGLESCNLSPRRNVLTRTQSGWRRRGSSMQRLPPRRGQIQIKIFKSVIEQVSSLARHSGGI